MSDCTIRKFDPNLPLTFMFYRKDGKVSTYDITARDLDWFISSVKPDETYGVFYREEEEKKNDRVGV